MFMCMCMCTVLACARAWHVHVRGIAELARRSVCVAFAWRGELAARLRLQQLKLGRLRLRLRRHDPIIYSHRDRDRHWQRCAQNLHARCRDLDEWPPIDLDSQLHSGLTHDVRHVAALQTKLALEDLHLLGECRRRRADWRHRALSEAFFISRRKETPRILNWLVEAEERSRNHNGVE